MRMRTSLPPFGERPPPPTQPRTQGFSQIGCPTSSWDPVFVSLVLGLQGCTTPLLTRVLWMNPESSSSQDEQLTHWATPYPAPAFCYLLFFFFWEVWESCYVPKATIKVNLLPQLSQPRAQSRRQSHLTRPLSPPKNKVTTRSISSHFLWRIEKKMDHLGRAGRQWKVRGAREMSGRKCSSNTWYTYMKVSQWNSFVQSEYAS